jgi:CBS domain-containing protein
MAVGGERPPTGPFDHGARPAARSFFALVAGAAAYANEAMANRVREIMNHEVFCVVPDELAGDVRGYFHTLGIAAAPVVDDGGKPIGFVSARDLSGADDDMPISECMTRQADVVALDTSIADAAARMADRGRHHLAVVDAEGRTAGYIGSLDVIRGLLGKPVPHPDSFPHYDRDLDVSWTDDLALSEANAARAPDGPGLLRLVRSRAGQPDRIVWSEGTHNVRTRVLDLVAGPPYAMPHLVDELDGGQLRFRAAATKNLAKLAHAMHPKPASTER